MKILKLWTVLATLALSVTLLTTGAWAKPDKGKSKYSKPSGNHGKTVSSKARNKSDSRYKNHGQKVSKTANSKAKSSSNVRRPYVQPRYRTTRRYNPKTRRYENTREYYHRDTRTWHRR